MRRDGKTTRLIDEAIQHLFREENLYVPTQTGMCAEDTELTDEVRLFVDPDYKMGNYAQSAFISRLLKRLSSEHNDQEYEIIKNKHHLHFKIAAKKK